MSSFSMFSLTVPGRAKKSNRLSETPFIKNIDSEKLPSCILKLTCR